MMLPGSDICHSFRTIWVELTRVVNKTKVMANCILAPRALSSAGIFEL